MKKGKKIISIALGFGIVATSAISIYAHALVKKPLHSIAGSSLTTNTHVNKLQLLGVKSATETHVHELGKDPALNTMLTIGKNSYTNKVVIVTFHDISPKVYSHYVITPEQFSADLAIISRDFHVITNTEFINFLNHKGFVPQNAVLLTFDDGYKGMYNYALPTLLDYHMSGTFFDIVGTADKNRPNNLSWGEIRQMAHDGMSMESHTYESHYEVTVGKKKMLVPVFNTRITVHGKPETVAQYHQRVYTDFRKARSELESNLGQTVQQFAWPYGWSIPMATYIAHQVGYEYLYTTTGGYVTSRTYRSAIPRIDIGKPSITPGEAEQMILGIANGHHYPHQKMQDM